MATDGYQQADVGVDNEDDDLFGDNELDEDIDFDNADGIPSSALDSYLEQADEPPVLNGSLLQVDTPAPNSEIPEEANNELDALFKEGMGNDGDELEGIDMSKLNERELDVGEKAEGAEDFEDISDDDLPDEEPAGDPAQLPHQEASVLQAASGGDFDDELFGPSSPIAGPAGPSTRRDEPPPDSALDKFTDDQGLAEDNDDNEDQPSAQDEMSPEEYRMWRVQQALFGMPDVGPVPMTLEENMEEKFKLQFPNYDLNEPPLFNKLFPPRPTKPGVLMAPARPPKSIRPTKVTLELEPDQRLLFNTSSTTAPSFRHDLVRITEPKATQDTSESSDESDPDEPLPGGVTMEELEFLCTDFDTLSAVAASDAELEDLHIRALDSDTEMTGFDDLEHPQKKRRLGLSAHEIVSIHQMDLPSFDNPERAAKKLSRKVVLDLNDPTLLVEEIEPDAGRAKARQGAKTTSTTKTRLESRFKISNDAEYDLLKQNHQHKVRGELGHVSVKHSAPALRLQYPYFRVKLEPPELRNHHRKRLIIRYPIGFSLPGKTKRKHLKGKEIKEIYHDTKNLSPADNSTAVLLEYSEQNPLMLSQAGMGSRIVNYYRRKTKDDTTRPKHELGDTQVLLPEDKSPFFQFGHIDPGEEMTALTNLMYRAPIFEQKMQPTDFLVVRETNTSYGQRYFMRNVDHLFVVGQQLPAQTIPGTHSRMVTTTAKNRLKAISYRIARKNVKRHNRIRVEEVTKHFPDSSDMQNRQKMKEFMSYNKDAKEWEVRASEGGLPEEDQIQALIKPEDVCLLEAMQVGHQYLVDAGYNEEESDEDDDKDKDDQNDNVDKQLAPWRTTKNFMQATQGKAMLQLYGEGDPSGRGEAFSFLKTSMKGGFKAQGAPIQDALQRKKEYQGHSYNVAAQQRSYEQSIRQIWDRQKASLGSQISPSDMDMDGDVDGPEEFRNSARATPGGTPAPSRRVDDETGTSFSRRSVGSQPQKFLKITRLVRENGERVEKYHIETDPAVIKGYLKSKAEVYQGLDKDEIEDFDFSGNTWHDNFVRRQFQRSLDQHTANIARREQRRKKRKSKAGGTPAADDGEAPADGEPETPASATKKQEGTQRKCANCGQVGHIKTNKKLCPLLNGTMSNEDQMRNTAFMGAPPTLP